MIFSLLFWNEPKPADHSVPVRTTIKAASLKAWLDQSLTQNPNTTGAVALVDVPGQIDWLAAAGFEGPSGQVKMATSSRFIGASLLEPMIATLVLQLVEEEQLSLETPVAEFLDIHLLNLLTNGHGEALKLRHLLNHSSGIDDYRRLEGLEMLTDPQEVLQRVLEDGIPQGIPAENAASSATNFLLLRLILETITAEPIAQRLLEQLLLPLGMRQTTVLTGPLLEVETTVADVRRFVHALASGMLLKPTTLQQMLRPTDGNLGFGVQNFSYVNSIGRVWGTSSSSLEYSTCVLYAEKYDAIIIYSARHYYGPLHYPQLFTDLVLSHLAL